jgi:hypothetical protein
MQLHTNAKLLLQEGHVLRLVLLQQLHALLIGQEIGDGLDRRLQALQASHHLTAPRPQRVRHLRFQP